ncbi:MAG: asparagine synthase (glutamine-hydrolyzing) [Lentisphaerae bacterium GWF2_52_8]|nr:MAG: asparagine synthase (glutamine-hydrolyzing) [Lentisphaerae bacterium GWF2_52_8]
MCGIAGILNIDGVPADREILAAMNAAQLHRGPDSDGIFCDGALGLAHRRLSIIDLSGGAQPLCNEDKSVWTSFNGEIYNYPELRAELQRKGHCFKTNSDTEVIVHLYEEHGTGFVSRLNGMFAFAVYDKKKGLLLLARDRLGKKPLHYFLKGGAFAFASELQALRQHPEMPPELDLQAIWDYFSLQYIPSPNTAWLGVKKLPPAHTLLLSAEEASQPILTRYWRPDYRVKTMGSLPELKEELRALLKDAVWRRLMSDVPYGAFLSGGIDSTIIVGLMTELCAQPVEAFTIGFSEERYDERIFARRAVSHLQERGRSPIKHYEHVVNPCDFDAVVKLVSHYGEPYSDASMLPTYFLSKFTRERVTVALSGDGADELFGGYNRYLLMNALRRADILPLAIRRPLMRTLSAILSRKSEERSLAGRLRRIFRASSVPEAERYFEILCRFDESSKRQICGNAFADAKPVPTLRLFTEILSSCSSSDPTEKFSELDLHSYLPGDILTKVDIASMANSLELRSPFLDYRVAEFSAKLPWQLKLHGRSRKFILSQSFPEFFPPGLDTREKMGFGVPLANWFRGAWKEPLREHILGGESVRLGFLRKDAAEKLCREHAEAHAEHSYILWSLLIFELFLRQTHKK